MCYCKITIVHYLKLHHIKHSLYQLYNCSSMCLELLDVIILLQVYVYLCCFERNILYPVVFLACLTSDSPAIVRKLGPYAASLVITVCALKCLRCAFSHPPSQYLILAFACLFFQLDYAAHSETFIVDYFVTAIAFSKTHEFLLKVSCTVLVFPSIYKAKQFFVCYLECKISVFASFILCVLENLELHR